MRDTPKYAFVRPGETPPAGLIARPWPDGTVSTGNPIDSWPLRKVAIAAQPQLRPLKERPARR